MKSVQCLTATALRDITSKVFSRRFHNMMSRIQYHLPLSTINIFGRGGNFDVGYSYICNIS